MNTWLNARLRGGDVSIWSIGGMIFSRKEIEVSEENRVVLSLCRLQILDILP
jgi:hypothetical protein